MSKITREKFDTYKNVFDEHTIRNLFKLSTEGFFEDLESPLLLGKEANVFLALRKDGSNVIVKIYRLQNCNFNKMFDYIKQDPRYENLGKKRREIIFAWTQREYRNLLLAREVIRVPQPLKVKDNIIIMELIGKDDIPAPELKDEYPKNAEKFCDMVIENMKKLYKAGLVHGDLSQFNILNNDDEPIFIDFSQATVSTNPQADELLIRDIKNIVSFFSGRLKLNINADEVYKRIKSDKISNK